MSLINFFLPQVSCSRDGVEYSKDGKTLLSTPTKLITFTVPSICEIISGGDSRTKSSFYNCIDVIKSVDCEKDCLLNCIYPFAFFESSLETIDLTNCINLSSLNHSIFMNCKKLNKVLLPEGILRISNNCFRACDSLVSIKIPDSVTRIAGYSSSFYKSSFGFCSNLEEIILTENSNLIELGSDNLINTKVKSLYIPRNATSIVDGIYGGKVATIKKHPENNNFVIEDNFLLNSNRDTILYACYTEADEFIVPSYVTSIRSSAFRYNGMKKVIFKSKINSIGNLAFDCCYDLTSFEFPENNMTSVPHRFLSNCLKLVSVTLTPNIVTIDSESFINCTLLSQINIERITSIGNKAFFGCTSLVTFNCPVNLSKIDYAAFAGCVNLDFNLNGNTHLNIIDDVLYDGNYARAYFGKSGEVKIASTGVGAYAFYQSKITKVIFTNEFPEGTTFDISISGFRESSIQEITLPACTSTIKESAFQNCTQLTRVVIPKESTITEIPVYCFMCCTLLNEVSIPNTITTICDFAFSECNSLQTINLEENDIFKLGKYSFYGTKLATLKLPNTVESIDENCFASSSLTRIDFSATSFTTIIQNTFYNCRELTEIIFSDNIEVINGLAFGMCTSLKNVEFPLHIKKVSARAFENCWSLQEIILKKDCDLEEISGQTFKGCKQLTNVTVPADDTKFFAEDGVLMNQNKTLLKLFLPGSPLKIFVIPGSIENIGNYAFQDCVNLEAIAIPEGKVTSIGYRAFDGCKSLSTVWLPRSIITFGKEAFINCPNLKCGSVAYKKGNIEEAIKAGIPPIAFEVNCPTIKISHCYSKCSFLSFGLLFSLLLTN